MPVDLYLDDNRPTPEGWKRAHTAEEAKTHLLVGSVNRLSLDFDLDNPPCERCSFDCGLRETGCRHGCDCHRQGDETGLDLLHWMREHNRWPQKKPTVHSHNIIGALRMKHFIDQHFPG
jgi:hypothetical protein